MNSLVKSIKLEQLRSEADKALEAADASALHALCMKATADIQALLHAVCIMVEHGNERIHPTEAISSIESVALAAIDLAKTVACGSSGAAARAVDWIDRRPEEKP